MEKNLCLAAVVFLPLLLGTANSSFKRQAQEVLKDCRLALQRPCPDYINIKFHLFTRQNQEKSRIVHVTETRDDFHKSFYNPNHPNKIIIHGLNALLYKREYLSIKDAYLEKQEANVFMVDWSKLSRGGACVFLSIRNIDHVANCTAQLMSAIDRRALSDDIHVIADRVGVRVAHQLANGLSSMSVNRITGLNPEGGVLPFMEDSKRLNSWDADFVDTIHTLPFLPKTKLFGDVDFYVNPNRIHQPGCEKNEDKFECDQTRALEYFAESITTDVGFLGWKCPSYTQYTLGMCNPHDPLLEMGDSCSLKNTGFHLVYTAPESPYALGHWEEPLYKDKGPEMRTDIISKVSTKVKNKFDQLEQKTPDILKEMGIINLVKARVENEANDLRANALQLGLQGAKTLVKQFMNKGNADDKGKT